MPIVGTPYFFHNFITDLKELARWTDIEKSYIFSFSAVYSVDFDHKRTVLQYCTSYQGIRLESVVHSVLYSSS